MNTITKLGKVILLSSFILVGCGKAEKVDPAIKAKGILINAYTLDGNQIVKAQVSAQYCDILEGCITVQQAMNEAHVKYETTTYPDVPGDFLTKIFPTDGGTAYPETIDTKKFYWMLCIDGAFAQKGMSEQLVKNGQTIDWNYVKANVSNCPKR